ncbi:FGGY-family carbohydrate kinase [Shinella zoogloeoides]|jgi:FGGY-family pentulose kinase|uniref:FGGY-family carbohydrate kinase n=1 Tax=Shinella zoogloeoides TaxID=352475 RepID=UPI00273DEEE1|nr:FGGY-family carbohydrate kinase [Shinella zoogloeoides]WLR91571.1 FGGY-family carbohydrate kinase [Shinella zoogloeoides]
MGDLIVAVDIGTGSARAGVFDRSGRLLGRSEHPIAMRRPSADRAEHDSENIWQAVCAAVKAACRVAGADTARVAAFGVDATCSLVMRDEAGKPLAVSGGEDARWDTIVWLDHRALEEADFCTATKHPVLAHSGHVMSPEMEMPKLMWLKRHQPEQWAKAGYFFDLADFITWRATGSNARSRCTMTAKWNHRAHEKERWSESFLKAIGLEDVRERGSLPDETVPVGNALGRLTPDAAHDLGLSAECVVATGLIDAYAGTLGVLGRFAGEPETLERQFALIGGTSSCIVAFSRSEKFGFGMWGPYYEAVLPGWWLVEGGQSATGALLDHIVRAHSAGGEPDAANHARIIARIRAMRQEEGDGFAARLHVLPDFHGNRSPLADPHALGVISGLALDASFDGLCRLYWRTSVAIALGIRHILEKLGECGYRRDTLHIAGGHVHNPLLLELYRDVTGCRIVVPETGDAVLLGTAMVAATAGGLYPDLAAAGAAMSPGGTVLLPDARRKAGYDRDYRRFLALVRHRAELETID